MFISKVMIENFKCYGPKFSLTLNKGTNILVGNNEAGKSTIIEAIHLALSGILHGKYLKNELSQYLFNRTVENAYVASLTTAERLAPPKVLIELYIEGEDSPAFAALQGDYNCEKTPSHGIRFSIEFDDQFKPEYEILVSAGNIKTIPIEYYKVVWKSFARTSITSKSIPVKSALVDSATARYSNGSDAYISRIVRENLDEKERVEISQAHREMKESFMIVPAVVAINGKLAESAKITNKSIKISVDLSTQNAWEMSLMTYLDDVPFHYAGRGEQNIVKTSLALAHKKAKEANVILLEEPENHLSHAKLNELTERITSGLGDKQIIVSTHSSFVANKLGLEHLILLNESKAVKIAELSPGTIKFFTKLAGYDTLRLVLCKKAILVEGDSDELVVQKAYFDQNKKLPIQDGIDVISVGTAFLRFLELAKKIKKPVSVVTDNDGDVAALRKKYEEYLGKEAETKIKICFDTVEDAGSNDKFNYNTLEPKLVKANGDKKINEILGKTLAHDDLLNHLKNNKVAFALTLFDSKVAIQFPQYILDGIS